MNAPIENNKSEPSTRQSLWNYILTAVVSAAGGARTTWLITSQRSKSEFHPLPLSPPATAVNATPDLAGLRAGDAAVVLGNFSDDPQRGSQAMRRYGQTMP